MASILGRGNLEYLMEDDGTLWSMDRRQQFDPKTYEPIEAKRDNPCDLREKRVDSKRKLKKRGKVHGG